MAKKMTRKETAKHVLDVLSKLPSKELIAWTFVDFGCNEKVESDCRFCPKGALLVWHKNIRLLPEKREITYGRGGFDKLDADVMDALERAAFRAREYMSEQTKTGLQEIYNAVLQRCQEIIEQ